MTTNAPSLLLEGKIAIVTGASRSIGASTALEFAKRGAKVAITFVSSSSSELADQVVSTINRFGNGASAIKIQADVVNVHLPKRIVAKTVAAFDDSIDILVNNASEESCALLADITLEGYNSIFDTNVRSVILMTQAVLPHRRDPGRIINLGSTLGRIGQPTYSVYSATTASLEALSRS